MMFQPGLGGERVYETGKVLSLYGPAYIATVEDADDALSAAVDAAGNDANKLAAAADKVESAAVSHFDQGHYKRAAPLFGLLCDAYLLYGDQQSAALAKGLEARCYLKLAESLLAAAQPSSAKTYADEAVELYAVALDLAAKAGLGVDKTVKLLARQAEAKAISVAVSKGKEIVSPQDGKTEDGKTEDGKTGDGDGDKKTGDGNGDKKGGGVGLALGIGAALWLLLRR